MIDWHIPPVIIMTPWGAVGLAAVVSAVYLYANLSRRLGAVTKMPPFYRWFLVGGGFMGLALSVSVLRRAVFLSCAAEVAFLIQPEFGFFFYQVPLLIGTLINVVVAWRYWSWLVVGEQGK